jgi:hypothetical protein
VLTARDARAELVSYLVTDATAHEAGRFDAIGRRFDSFEHRFPTGADDEVTELRIALTFWDAWIDARNHEWQTTARIQPAEWPALARAIAADLQAERPIANASIRARFDAVSHPNLDERVSLLAGRLRERETR